MPERKSEKQLSVALLLSDFDEVKKISAVFRKLGIIPHFYEDLKTFWHGTLENIPSLCIVDVKKMSEQELILRDHPAVVAEKLPLVFFYSKNTEPLLVSTYDFFHLGLLKKEESYEGGLRVILRRLNYVLQLESQNQSQKEDLSSQQSMIEKLKSEKLIILHTDQYQMMVKKICLQFEEIRGEFDFCRSVEKIFQNMDEIAEFAMFELSFNGQKLISPVPHVSKMRAMPSLWPARPCLRGIELFAQNMAIQAAMDVMGGDVISLLIKGNHTCPDNMIFVKAKNELFYHHFDWNLLEAYLNGFYASSKNILEREPTVLKKFTSSFEAMSYLDQFLFETTTSFSEDVLTTKQQDVRLIDVDLRDLIDLVLKKGNNRFFWNKFEKEFINKLSIQSRIEFRVFEYGVSHLSFLVESTDLDYFFDELKDFSSRFSYWKYFEENEGVLAQIVKPKVRMIPLSAFAYLKANQESIQEGNKEILAKVKTKDLIWGRGSDNEI